MTPKQSKRSGYDVSDWIRDHPGIGLGYLLDNIQDFFDPERPDDASTIKRIWSLDEIRDHKKNEPIVAKEIEQKKTVSAPSLPTDREVIIAGKLCDVVDDAVSALDPKKIFSQSGYLVKIIETDNTTVSIREFNAVGIADALSRSATWRKWQKNKKTGELELTQIDGPTDKIAKAVVARGEYKSVHTIHGVTESPFFRKDGTICSDRGFDPESGFFLHFNLKIRDMPDTPTADQAKRALAFIREPFSEFPFIDEQSRMVPISLILSVMARPMLGNLPTFILDASTRGSGKTLISDIVSMILTGKPSPKFSWPAGREYNVELEKIMNTVAMMGVPIMCFDNIPSATSFGGQVIEKFVTCNGRVNFRKLGGNENRDVFFNTAIIANGNNIVDGIQDETRRRALPCRMVPDCEKPEDRTGFKHSPLPEYVMDNRAKFLEAGLLILKYSLQNTSKNKYTWGSFEEFAKIIPHSIIAAGGPNILDNRDLVPSSGGDENEAMCNLLELLECKFVAGFRAKDIIAKASSDDVLRDSLESIFWGAVPNSTQLGKRLRGRKDRLHNGMKIVEIGKSGGSTKWNIVKTIQPQLDIDAPPGAETDDY